MHFLCAYDTIFYGKEEESEPPVREFADRGTLWLLDMPQNLRGLLKLTAAHLVDKLDFHVLDEVIERRVEELREVEMTGAEALIRRGRREGRAEGREEGRAEGREKGREEGSDAGQRALLLKQLTVKFGPLSEEIVAQVQALSAAQRERLAERLLVAGSLADLELSAKAG